MSPEHKQNLNPLQRTLTTLLLVIGSAAPMAIAFFLVSSTNHGDNPLDKIRDTETLPTETLVMPFDGGEVTTTQYEYWKNVRIVIEGSGQTDGSAYSDAFYLFTDADGQPLDVSQMALSGLEIDGQRALESIEGEPPPYNSDHLYAVLYDAGPRARRLTFRVAGDASTGNSGTLTITIVELKN